jgi:hypothetical protein
MRAPAPASDPFGDALREMCVPSSPAVVIHHAGTDREFRSRCCRGLDHAACLATDCEVGCACAAYAGRPNADAA